MLRSKKWMAVAVVLMGAIVFGSPTQARAAFTVNVYEDGTLVTGGSVVPIDSQNILYAFTSANSNLQFFNVTSGSGTSNNPGTQGGSNLDLANNTKITTNFGAAGGTHTIRIELTQDGWNAPTGTPLTLSSSAGGSTAYLGGTNPSATQTITATYQGFLDNTNALFGKPAAGSTPIQTASTTQSAVGTKSLVFSPATSSSLVPGGTPFSMTDVLEFTFTLSAGSGQASANVSASTVASVPAPAGVVLALTGLPILGIGNWLRRRRTV